MAKKPTIFDENFAFYEQLWFYYEANRGKIRSRYNDLTKKFLAYNDKKENPDAFLRQPQFEALEMYVFIKEFIDNAHMYEMFDKWRKREDYFSDASYYTIHKGGQGTLPDLGDEQNEIIFKQMKKYKEAYPNYIYALTMGLGKTILMGTCIFYEFLLAKKYPKDKRFCHNALVFAPDKTVLESLREIMTFDKTKVVPPEYASVLDSNIKFHFLIDSGVTLHTIDDSDFNIVISNNQKIIVKKKRKEDTPTDILFGSGSLLSDLYADDEDDGNDVWDDSTLMDNQRFKKLCRLPQLGVYVDEAHHLFGANLEKELRSGGANKTTLRNTINMLAESTSIVACYNYTGTPYVNKQVLPEVVYAYGLNESIRNGFLKDADPIGFENVKNEEFLKNAIGIFWERYGGKTYENLPPKLAIFAANVKEATDVVRPCVEKILSDLNIPLSTILVNTGDSTVTKDEDIRNFNNLDVVGTEGSKKQFIILVEKGREGWNCRSLLGIALFRSPSSKIFVLQATMRCLRKLTDDQLKATVFLSKENMDTLDDELQKNYNMELKDLGKTSTAEKHTYKVRVMPPERKIRMKRIWHEYSLVDNRDPNLISNTLFIKDGPMMLNGQYSKLVPNIREFLNYAKNQGRPIHLVASEKSGAFFDYLSLSSRFVKPEPGKIKYAVLNHGYIRRVIQRAPDRGNPYGLRTNWGEKVFVFLDENTHMVLNMTTGGYEKGDSYPSSSDIIGLERILATLPALISRKYEGALYPVELVNGIASMSNYPSTKILQDFVKDMI